MADATGTFQIVAEEMEFRKFNAIPDCIWNWTY
jgi:hypothetical protein